MVAEDRPQGHAPGRLCRPHYRNSSLIARSAATGHARRRPRDYRGTRLLDCRTSAMERTPRADGFAHHGARAMTATLDPITLEVLTQSLISVVREMRATVFRTAK